MNKRTLFPLLILALMLVLSTPLMAHGAFAPAITRSPHVEATIAQMSRAKEWVKPRLLLTADDWANCPSGQGGGHECIIMVKIDLAHPAHSTRTTDL